MVSVVISIFFTCILKLDLEYRKKWDHYVVKLDVIDKDPQTKSEVVQWITNYPVSTVKLSKITVNKNGYNFGHMFVLITHVDYFNCT